MLRVSKEGHSQQVQEGGVPQKAQNIWQCIAGAMQQKRATTAGHCRNKMGSSCMWSMGEARHVGHGGNKPRGYSGGAGPAPRLLLASKLT